MDLCSSNVLFQGQLYFLSLCIKNLNDPLSDTLAENRYKFLWRVFRCYYCYSTYRSILLVSIDGMD